MDWELGFSKQKNVNNPPRGRWICSPAVWPGRGGVDNLAGRRTGNLLVSRVYQNCFESRIGGCVSLQLGGLAKSRPQTFLRSAPS